MTRRLEDDDPDDSLPSAAIGAVSPTVSSRETKLLEAQTPATRTKAIPRRALVAGLAALVVGGGAIAYIIQEAAHTSSSGSQPGNPSGTKAPTHSTLSAQPGAQSGSQPGSQPPPQSAPAAGSTPTQATQPTPPSQPVQLTLQITNCPQTVNNNTNVLVTVTANQPGVSTQLIVTYDLVSDIFKSQARPTDSNDTVVLTWHVGFVTSLLDSVLNAHVTAVATDQNGKQVQSPSVQVQIHLL